MRKLWFFVSIFYVLNLNAQNYLISFEGTGAATTINTVKVENLTKGTYSTLNGSDILRLTVLTGIKPTEETQSSELKIYPNPMIENSILEINPPVAGDATISVFEMTGKPVFQIHSYLENIRQEFRLSGLKHGFYLVSVKGNNYQLSGKLLCNGREEGFVKIEKINWVTEEVNEKQIKADNKGTLTTVDMVYSVGDRLKFTGISGNYGTIVTDIPANDKIITFNLISCSDADGNNYSTVKIGAGKSNPQGWMAENLKTTKYNDGTTIPNVTSNTTWAALITDAACDYANSPANSTTYGRLYNWYVAASTNSKNVCPTGWHVPTDTEWTTLTSYLGGLDVASGKLKETGFTHWNSPNEEATNESGFSALPGGACGVGGPFDELGLSGAFWSSTGVDPTSAMDRTFRYDDYLVYRSNGTKQCGLSVRCLKD
jgi:uncharacterized protein (TIGR02145 family)